MEQFAPTFVAFDVAEDFCVPAALPSQSVIGEILLAENCGSIARVGGSTNRPPRTLLPNSLSEVFFPPLKHSPPNQSTTPVPRSAHMRRPFDEHSICG